MSEPLNMWRRASDTYGAQVQAEFQGNFGEERIRLVFRKTLDWDAPEFFDGMEKRIIALGSCGYWRYGSTDSLSWKEAMMPGRMALPIDLAVIYEPMIFVRAAAQLFEDVTPAQLEAIEKDMKSPPSNDTTFMPVSQPQEEPRRTYTPPTTPEPEGQPFSLLLPDCFDSSEGEEDTVRFEAKVERRGRKQRPQGIWKTRREQAERVGRHKLSVSARGNGVRSRRTTKQGVMSSR